MAAVISIVFTMLLMPSFIPTVNSLDMTDNPAANFDDDIVDDITDPFDILAKNSWNTESNYKYSPKEGIVYKVVSDNEKEFENAIRAKEKDESNIKEYEESLTKIRENYIEIQKEVLKLEDMKKDLLNERSQNFESKKEIESINNEIEELKSEKKETKKTNLFYVFLVSSNFFVLVLFFIFSKSYKLKKDSKNEDYFDMSII